MFCALCYNSKINEAVVMEPNVREPRRREDERYHEPRGEKQREKATCARECDVAGCAPYIGHKKVRERVRKPSDKLSIGTTVYISKI